MLDQRLQIWDPFAKETPFHSATACNFPRGQCGDPLWTVQMFHPWGHWQTSVSSLAPQWGGITTSPTALCWARPHTVLGTSALLRTWHICSVFTCVYICGVLFEFGFFNPSFSAVGCAYHSRPNARRGRWWSMTPQPWLVCLTAILKTISWVKLWNPCRNTE